MPDPDVTTPDPAPDSAEPTGLLAQVRGVISQVSESVTEVLTLGAAFSVLGFVVVNLYLLQYTAIHGFNLVAGQYVAAAVLFFIVSVLAGGILYWVRSLIVQLDNRGLWGVILVLFVPLVLSGLADFDLTGVWTFLGRAVGDKTLGQALFLLLFMVYTTALMTGLARLLQTPKADAGGAARLIDKLSHAFDKVYARFFKGLAYLIIGFVVVVVVGTFFLAIYGAVPHALGGGKPSPAVLILAGDEDADTLNLRMDAVESLHTAPLEILAELNDGLLIRAEDEQGAIAVLAVKHDSIRAILSVPEALLPTPAPTATATPPSVPTPTP